MLYLKGAYFNIKIIWQHQRCSGREGVRERREKRLWDEQREEFQTSYIYFMYCHESHFSYNEKCMYKNSYSYSKEHIRNQYIYFIKMYAVFYINNTYIIFSMLRILFFKTSFFTRNKSWPKLRSGGSIKVDKNEIEK